MGEPDHYDTLGIPRDAGAERIRRAWREACFRYHPDSGRESADPRKLHAAREAFRVLSDPGRRARYDRLLVGRPGRRDEPPIFSVENVRENYRFLRGQALRVARAVWNRFVGP
jgi:curved DNA-binding protein CbpA